MRTSPIVVKKDGSISVHCRIAAGKDPATFKRLFGVNATVYGNCPVFGFPVAGTDPEIEPGIDPEPTPVPGGGIAPVCDCPESMITLLSEILSDLEPDRSWPERLMLKETDWRIEQITSLPYGAFANNLTQSQSGVWETQLGSLSEPLETEEANSHDFFGRASSEASLYFLDDVSRILEGATPRLQSIDPLLQGQLHIQSDINARGTGQ